MQEHFSLWIWILGCSCLFMFGLGFVLTLHGAARRRFFSLPAIVQRGYVGLFLAPIVAIPLVPQPRYQVAEVASIAAGATLLVCALALWVLALRAMRGIPSMREAKGLVTSSVYGWVRNPLYTGNALVLPGLGLLTQSVPALLFAPPVLGLFLIQSILEERGLSSEYGEAYAAYRARVRSRLVPFLF